MCCIANIMFILSGFVILIIPATIKVLGNVIKLEA